MTVDEYRAITGKELSRPPTPAETSAVIRHPLLAPLGHGHGAGPWSRSVGIVGDHRRPKVFTEHLGPARRIGLVLGIAHGVHSSSSGSGTFSKTT